MHSAGGVLVWTGGQHESATQTRVVGPRWPDNPIRPRATRLDASDATRDVVVRGLDGHTQPAGQLFLVCAEDNDEDQRTHSRA